MIKTLFSFFFLTITHTVIIMPFLQSEVREIGEKIWANECGKSYNKLLYWNPKEPFPSLGICHFIWHPAGSHHKQTETFPALLAYFQKNKYRLPAWLEQAKKSGAPWHSSHEMQADPRAAELKELLSNTIELQAQFVIDNFMATKSKLSRQAPRAKCKQINTHIRNLEQSPAGQFALIDYFNFKGDGCNPAERYANQGWGLLQVLELMPKNCNSNQELLEFKKAAKQALERRVANAPQGKEHESQWLPGWIARIERY